MITAGPITNARPGWGLKKGAVTSLVTNDAGGRPEVLAAQMLCGAAMSGARVLMLLPHERDSDSVWQTMITLLAGGDRRNAGQTLRHLPIALHAHGMGWDKIGGADLVYAPGLSSRELRRIDIQASPPMLVVGKDFDHTSALNFPSETIRVGGDCLVVDSEGFEVPVVYDASGPIYRPA